MDLEELLALWNDEAARGDMTDEQLQQLRDGLQEHARTLLEGDRTDAVLAELDELAVTVEAIETIQTERTTAAAQRDERADEIATRIFGQADDGDDGEAADEPAAPDAEVETPEVDAETETPAVEAEVAEPIAAAAAPPLRITRVAARRPESSRPRPTTGSPLSLVASANIGGDGRFGAGTPLETVEDLSAAFVSAWQHSEGYQGPRAQISVARAGGDALALYGEDRYLTSDSRGNARKIAAVTSPEAITASGGACVPPPVDYTQPIITGSQARPLRDGGMTRFGADRGGIVTLPPPVIEDVASAISDWTLATDTNPGNATKPCLTITCPDDTTGVVAAIVNCLKVGNFRSRFFGEQVAAWVELAAVNQARHAERLLLTAIGTGSTAVTSGTVLGTSRDVLTTLDRAVASLKSRHRAENLPIRWAAPFWLKAMIRTDIARQIPVGTVDETLALADAAIERWLAVRQVNVTWLLDGVAGQQFLEQGDAPLAGWPSTVVTYLYPEGSWLFLDGGMFDFGVVRDSTLNATNDFTIFAETLEGAHFHGVESWKLTMDVCPDGSTSLGVDIAPCSTGS